MYLVPLFYWWRKPEYPRKQLTNVITNFVPVHLTIIRIRTHYLLEFTKNEDQYTGLIVDSMLLANWMSNHKEMRPNQCYRMSNHKEMRPNQCYRMSNQKEIRPNQFYRMSNHKEMRPNQCYRMSNHREIRPNQCYLRTILKCKLLMDVRSQMMAKTHIN